MTPETRGTRPRAGLLIVALVLLGLVVVGRLALSAWLDRPVPTRLPEVGATTAEARPLCFIVVDGLREQSAWAEDDPPMPFFQAFARRGASGVAWAGDPTLTAPCVRAMLTGRAPDLVTGFRNFDADPVQGSFIQYLHARGARTAHAGDATIYQLCRPYYPPADALAIPDQGPTDLASDEEAVPFLLERIRRGADVVTLHLTRPDHVGHMSGATGRAYHEACRRVDEQLRGVVEAFLARQPEGLVFVGADHGVSPTGTHGGGEISARRAPFLLVGPGVAVIERVEISQFALAPTIAGLLGLPLPPLADAPPAPHLMDVSEERRLHVLDAYIQARLAVARSLGSEEVDPIERRRAAVTVKRMVGEEGEAYQQLASDLNDVLNPSSVGYAWATLVLAAVWLVAVVHLANVGTTSQAGGRVLLVLTSAAFVLSIGIVPAAVAGACLLVASLGVFLVTRPARPVGTAFLVACLAAIPVLTAAGLSLQSAWEMNEDPTGAEVRLAVVGIALLGVLALLVRPRRLLERWRARTRAAPALIAAFGGVALGFTLTLRPFLNPLIGAGLPGMDVRLLFALAGAAAVAVVALRPAARARSAAAGALFLVGAVLLFLGPRVADAWLGASWLEVVARRDPLWLGLGLFLTLLVPVAVARGTRGHGGRFPARREDLPGLALAILALIAAYAVRLDETPSAHLSRGANLLGLAALLVTLVRGSPDGRLLVRLLATVALARRLTALDGELVPFLVLTLGAALAVRWPAPSSRRGLAWLAVILLAVRIAAHHAMGGVESFSTVDVAAGFVGMEAAPSLETGGAHGVTWPIFEAILQLTLRFALPWVVLFSATAYVLGDRARLRTVVGDLSLTYAARGAAIAFALWAWWRSAWWVEQARAVYALGAADVVLVALAALLLGAFSPRSSSRRARASRAAPGAA